MTEKLKKIAEDLRAERPVDPVTVRTFLNWFGAQRRRDTVVAYIRREMAEAGVQTHPDFESAWIDSPIGFLLGNDTDTASDRDAAEIITGSEQPQAEMITWISRDPTYLVSKLPAANQKIVSVKPDGTLSELITIMMMGGYSQIPVMTSEREVKGIATWKSIGSRMSLGNNASTAKDVMEPHQEIRSDTSIFTAIPSIVTHEYVLVRNNSNVISGIITVSDLAIQFRVLTEPFLLLSELENMIRNIIGINFTPAELDSVRDPSSSKHAIESVSDMTFGDYIRLLEEPSRWSKLNLSIDRATFCDQLDRVREIRNGVTHFDPDGISEDDLGLLRNFTSFLKDLEKMTSKAVTS